LRALLEAGAVVEHALLAGDLVEARRLLSYHLVSRDVTNLDASHVAGAAISSLAENLSDSVVAPLLAYRLGGLPTAYAYRAINTADAMLGYRTPELEWFGKPAARADDIVNWIPARLTALLIAIASGAPRESLNVARADARRCPSPNGGWPMAAMAGALGVVLVKRGVYTLHARGRHPTPADLARARRVTTLAAALATALVEVA
jgi:adenosylcobinamide-phosphate synthase